MIQQHIHNLLTKLEEFGTEEDLRTWKNSLFDKSVDYNDRDAVDEWYEKIVNIHAPRLVGHDPCFNELPLFVASTKELPMFGTVTACHTHGHCPIGSQR